jgi:hypothetical protein
MKLYMFRTVLLSTIRSLFTVQSAMVYVIQACRQLSSRTRMQLQMSASNWFYCKDIFFPQFVPNSLSVIVTSLVTCNAPPIRMIILPMVCVSVCVCVSVWVCVCVCVSWYLSSRSTVPHSKLSSIYFAPERGHFCCNNHVLTQHVLISQCHSIVVKCNGYHSNTPSDNMLEWP